MGRVRYSGAVLSVAKLTPGQERYYERSVAAGLDDYYAGRGESPGVWTGRGAAELGLEGRRAGGRARPADPRQPPAHRRRAARGIRRRGAITVERIDPVTGERAIGGEEARAGRRLRPRLLACPKSVSLLHALGDEETRRAVNEAHAAAWQAALAYLEDEACVIRRGTQRRRPRARARASSPPPTSTAPAGRRTRTCTRT